ncbi:MAG: response regulator [Nitrospinae bacterium]|nr:response regulator [Nitrospinota bacterium]
MIREAFEEALDGNSPVEIIFASDGVEVMDMLHRRAMPGSGETGPMPSLVIVDLNMPRKDGIETIRQIRATSSLRRLPVLVLSTSSSFLDIDRSYEAGANSYHVKPHEIPALAELFRDILGYWFGIVRMPSKGIGGINGG